MIVNLKCKIRRIRPRCWQVTTKGAGRVLGAGHTWKQAMNLVIDKQRTICMYFRGERGNDPV